MVGVVVEKKVRLVLAIMGVPSSSSSVGGGVLGWELSSWMAGPQVGTDSVDARGGGAGLKERCGCFGSGGGEVRCGDLFFGARCGWNCCIARGFAAGN